MKNLLRLECNILWFTAAMVLLFPRVSVQKIEHTRQNLSAPSKIPGLFFKEDLEKIKEEANQIITEINLGLAKEYIRKKSDYERQGTKNDSASRPNRKVITIDHPDSFIFVPEVYYMLGENNDSSLNRYDFYVWGCVVDEHGYKDLVVRVRGEARRNLPMRCEMYQELVGGKLVPIAMSAGSFRSRYGNGLGTIAADICIKEGFSIR